MTFGEKVEGRIERAVESQAARGLTRFGVPLLLALIAWIGNDLTMTVKDQARDINSIKVNAARADDRLEVLNREAERSRADSKDRIADVQASISELKSDTNEQLTNVRAWLQTLSARLDAKRDR